MLFQFIPSFIFFIDEKRGEKISKAFITDREKKFTQLRGHYLLLMSATSISHTLSIYFLVELPRKALSFCNPHFFRHLRLLAHNHLPITHRNSETEKPQHIDDLCVFLERTKYNTICTQRIENPVESNK